MCFSLEEPEFPPGRLAAVNAGVSGAALEVDRSLDIDSCLQLVRTQSEEIVQLQALLAKAMTLLDAAVTQLANRSHTVPKRHKGRPRKFDDPAKLLAAFESMRSEFRTAHPRSIKPSDLTVLRWWFKREFKRSNTEPREGLLLWEERRLKTFRNALSAARKSTRTHPGK
jgi:hypothetical protein